MTYMENVPVDINNDCHLFKNNIDYVQAEFMQTCKIAKESIICFLEILILYQYKND